MPELPEVEIARRQLDRWATGRRLARVHLVDPSVVRRTLSTDPASASPEGAQVVAALRGVAGTPLRHGKRLAWPLGDRALLVHLGMTGSWVRAPEPPPHARVGFSFEDGPLLWFVDPRRFGCVVPIPAAAAPEALREGLGPDALDEALDGPALRRAFGGRGAIKPALLDQARLAGLGNIHAMEALWKAGIAPARPGLSLSDDEWARLAAIVPEQLRWGIAEGDADELVYTNLGGDNPFAIYDREGEPCPRCGGRITRSILAGRGTWSCPSCQPT